MAEKYLKTYFTPDVLAAQQKYFGRAQPIASAVESDPLGLEEIEFIHARDSFYIATVNADGWPYIQHRGGPPGFLRALGPHTLGFADFKGNRQLLSTGNLAGDDRVALFLMDYGRRERLKINGHARVLDAREHSALADQLTPPALRPKVERIFLLEVVSFDWNCPQYITTRYTAAEVEQMIAPLKGRITELEGELRRRPARPE